MKYSYLDNNGKRSMTALIDGELYTATEDHPLFARIVNDVMTGVATASSFDVGQAVSQYMEVAEGVVVDNGTLYWDGQEMHGSLATKIVDSIKNGEEPDALMYFLARLNNNPSRNSRDQLFQWLDKSGFELTDYGEVVGYKSLNTVGDAYRSVYSGAASVNGVEQKGCIVQRDGDVVTMPRSEVTDNPAESCSYGLHVGTLDYAEGFTGDAVVKVLVDPADVVSVPNSDTTKMRVCQYTVVGRVDNEPIVEVEEGLKSFNFIQNSSWIDSVSYDNGTMRINTINGDVIERENVPLYQYENLVAADEYGGAGTYYHSYIK